MILPIDGDESSGWKPGNPTAFLSTPFVEAEPAFSPDGHWLAYHSNESGSFEIYVRPFPGPGGKVQVSTLGGLIPIWSPNRKELFYRTPDGKVMVAQYRVHSDIFSVEKPQLWFDGPILDVGANRNFDIHPDGQRFAILKLSDSRTETKYDRVTFISNFFDELRRLAPISKK